MKFVNGLVFVFLNILIFIILNTMSMSTYAQDIAAGERKSTTCAACHGPKGQSVNPMWPHLAGQQEQYLLKQLKAFSTGERNDPIMGPMAKTLSEQDMKDLAAYYSSIK